MRRIPIPVYADTSVYGGVIDEEFETPSRQFFDEVRSGRFHLVVSAIVADELRGAPQPVRTLFEAIRQSAEVVDVAEEAIHLQQAYVNAAIVSAKWATDALHVALATVAQCRLIVSWNFRHIVNFRRIPLYNGVNLAQGYGVIAIHTPQEVITREDEDV
jgi:predicted nucleic acid-binding protein